MRVLITGSREWEASILAPFLRAAFTTLPTNAVIVHGGAAGADTIAGDVAMDMGFTVERYPADWKRFGRGAGPVRNQAMVDLGADVCFAAPLGKSPGTRDCMRRARQAGIPVYELDAGVWRLSL